MTISHKATLTLYIIYLYFTARQRRCLPALYWFSAGKNLHRPRSVILIYYYNENLWMCPVQFTSTVNCKICFASSTFPLCRFRPFVRTYYHLLINHLRLLGIKVQEKITFSVTTIEMVTPTGK